MSLPISLGYRFMKMAYSQLIREYLEKIVQKTDTELDDAGLQLLDKIFDYQNKFQYYDYSAVARKLGASQVKEK